MLGFWLMIRGRTKQRRGFTLLETVVASTILVFALVSVLSLASHCFRYLTDIRRAARATQVLQQKMEDIRLMSWSQLNALSTTFADSNRAMDVVYYGSIATNVYASYQGTGVLMRVSLTLQWRDRLGVVQTNRLSTLIANGGLNRYIF